MEASAAPPELADYAAALHDHSLELLRHGQASLGGGDPDGGAVTEADERLAAARGRVLLEALPVGHASHDYVAAFTEHFVYDWLEAGQETASSDQEVWAAYMSALESERGKWGAITPPNGWAEFHGRWLDHLAEWTETQRGAEPMRLEAGTKTQAFSAGAASLRAVATGLTLYAEWLTIVRSEVTAAHPLPGADEATTALDVHSSGPQ